MNSDYQAYRIDVQQTRVGSRLWDSYICGLGQNPIDSLDWQCVARGKSSYKEALDAAYDALEQLILGEFEPSEHGSF